jgi:membrane-bound ClpP family serine protease
VCEIHSRACEERLVVAGDESLIGSIGVIIIATRGAAGPGEVMVKIRGGSEAFIAWSAEPIPRGSTVLVINNRGTRTVDVSPWVDPLDPFPDDAV